MPGDEAREEGEEGMPGPFSMGTAGQRLFRRKGVLLSSLCPGELPRMPAPRRSHGGERLEEVLALVSRRVGKTSQMMAEKGGEQRKRWRPCGTGFPLCL